MVIGMFFIFNKKNGKIIMKTGMKKLRIGEMILMREMACRTVVE
jgi:hypothetical protein